MGLGLSKLFDPYYYIVSSILKCGLDRGKVPEIKMVKDASILIKVYLTNP